MYRQVGRAARPSFARCSQRTAPRARSGRNGPLFPRLPMPPF